MQADAQGAGLRAMPLPASTSEVNAQQTLLVLDGVGMARHTCSVIHVEGRVVDKTLGFID